MSLPAGLLTKFVIAGPVSNADSWSIGVWGLPVGTVSQSQLDDQTTKCLVDFQAKFWDVAANPWKSHCAPATIVNSCKAYYYVDGVLTLQSASTVSNDVGTAGVVMPAYTAAVFSLHTTGFGRKRRGRIYLPATGGSLAGTTLQHIFVQGNADAMKNWLQGYALGNWQTSGASAGSLVVVSRVGAGSTAVINRVTLDSLPDTQHGRQSKAVATQNFSAAV